MTQRLFSFASRLVKAFYVGVNVFSLELVKVQKSDETSIAC